MRIRRSRETAGSSAISVQVPDRTFNITVAVRFVVVILTALAIYGAYVRYVIAKGHG